MKKGRYVFCGLLLAAIFIVYVCRLFEWQLSDGKEYAQQAVTSSSFVKLTGTRGEILDRNGEVLAGNRSVYNVTYNKLYWDADNRNTDLLEAIKLLESVGETWVDRLPIVCTGIRDKVRDGDAVTLFDFSWTPAEAGTYVIKMSAMNEEGLEQYAPACIIVKVNA